MTASSSENGPDINDEEYAQQLQQEEERLYQQQLRMNALTKADLELAKTLQNELASESLESDLVLARKLEQESLVNGHSSPTAMSKSIPPPPPTTTTTRTGFVYIDDDSTTTTTSGSKRNYNGEIIDLDADDDVDPDLALARMLQEEEDKKQKQVVAGPSSSAATTTSSSASTSYHVTDEYDPNPDLHGLFLAFNDLYFSGKLSMVEVKWSRKMTLCAGTCRYQMNGMCTVTLSEALLKFRPRSDMINTLLHEMIHALLFVTNRFDNHESHGPEFLREADRINKSAGTNITVYHTFHDEVNYYKTHVWKCNGPCQYRAPYFGIVSRSMNRPPQKADRWFADHQISCGGTYVKIKSPTPPIPAKSKKQKQEEKEKATNKKMTDFLLSDSP